MPTIDKYLCVHGHFYQPPRENPWLESVETQDSAAPYHDWNERITAECYAPNGASRIVNGKNEIIRILNNYARISYNFGPTLLSWLQDNAPRAYRMIVEADARSQQRFSGHGSAMAQVYNHVIMPLASTRDRITQIRWGIADFEWRFKRKPEGMWLSETAVDNKTLELLADHGILFTVLAPHQCARVRLKSKKNPSEAAWQETPGASVNTTQPYQVNFASGKSIAVFFYDGPASRAIAFEGLLNSGEAFATRLTTGYSENGPKAQLAHVATDGESYGHHHKHGEMALSYALRWTEQQKLAKLTNYGEFLARFPPKYEAQIFEDSSWSCSHGVERWRSDCGCNGGRAGWNQKWRAPLRGALDWLRDAIAPLTEDLGSKYFKNVWEARDAYIQVILDRSRDSVDRFFSAHASHELEPAERVKALELMELQRHTQLMYTSCGWFFDEISGIETVQVIAYAGRVLQLATDLFGDPASLFEATFIAKLRVAKSNDPREVDGGEIYMKRIKTMRLGLEQVAAHYAISSIFGNYAEEAKLFCYNVRRLRYDSLSSSRAGWAVGRASIVSHITEEAEVVAFGVLHFGDQNINAGVRRFSDNDEQGFDAYVASAEAAIRRADFPEVIRLSDRYFGAVPYSLSSLFTDEQRRIVKLILNTTLWEVENSLRTIYEDHASLLHFLSQTGLPKPPALSMAAGFAINAGLRRAIESNPVDSVQIHSLLTLARADQVTLDTQGLSYLADLRMKRAMTELVLNPENLESLEAALSIAKSLRELPFEVNLWQAQNIWYDTLKHSRNGLPNLSEAEYARWVELFHDLGRLLYIKVEELIVEEEPVSDTTMLA